MWAKKKPKQTTSRESPRPGALPKHRDPIGPNLFCATVFVEMVKEEKMVSDILVMNNIIFR